VAQIIWIEHTTDLLGERRQDRGQSAIQLRQFLPLTPRFEFPATIQLRLYQLRRRPQNRGEKAGGLLRLATKVSRMIG
jgi:hypothetical protein